MDEPRKHPIFLLLIVVAMIGSAPFLFVGRSPAVFLGLPLWLWSSLFFTVSLSVLIAWGTLRYWKDDSNE